MASRSPRGQWVNVTSAYQYPPHKLQSIYVLWMPNQDSNIKAKHSLTPAQDSVSRMHSIVQWSGDISILFRSYMMCSNCLMVMHHKMVQFKILSPRSVLKEYSQHQSAPVIRIVLHDQLSLNNTDYNGLSLCNWKLMSTLRLFICYCQPFPLTGYQGYVNNGCQAILWTN